MKVTSTVWNIFRNHAHAFNRMVLDLVSPAVCHCCGNEGRSLCDRCYSLIPLRSIQLCPSCERTITPSGRVCRSCSALGNTQLDQLIVASDYRNKNLAGLVHSFKYKLVSDLGQDLGSILLRSLLMHLRYIPDYIIPMPLHTKRLRWRGFNQSQLLSDYLSSRVVPGLYIPVLTDLVVRSRNTPPQMELKTSAERKKNIANAFSVNPDVAARYPIKGKRILVVDDICTTGATLEECAKVLQAHEPHTISAIVLARQK